LRIPFILSLWVGLQWNWCSIPGRGKKFHPLHSAQTGPVRWVVGLRTPTVKWPGLEAECLPLSSIEVKIPVNYDSGPPLAVITWCLIKHRKNFIRSKNVNTPPGFRLLFLSFAFSFLVSLSCCYVISALSPTTHWPQFSHETPVLFFCNTLYNCATCERSEAL
jgi:hypothetical protein